MKIILDYQYQEWSPTALLHKHSALSKAQAETWRLKLGGRSKQCPYSAPFMQQSRGKLLQNMLAHFQLEEGGKLLSSENTDLFYSPIDWG